jgi:hypothetical protein
VFESLTALSALIYPAHTIAVMTMEMNDTVTVMHITVPFKLPIVAISSMNGAQSWPGGIILTVYVQQPFISLTVVMNSYILTC